MNTNYVVINAITVPEGMGEEIEKRFKARKGFVDSQKGFKGFKLLRPVSGDSRYFVLTEWETKEDFIAWTKSEAIHKAHAYGDKANRHARTNPKDEASNSGGDTPHGENAYGANHHGDQSPVATKADLLQFEVALFSDPQRS